MYAIGIAGSMSDNSVKHLNPRQGITIDRGECTLRKGRIRIGVKHLNPRQGITMRMTITRSGRSVDIRVKHLNPRQGITIYGEPERN